MNRRFFLLAGLALGLAAPWPAFAAPAFAPSRFSVEVRGQGPDVILIPGLTSGRDVWATTVQSLPGYRYHLVQVAGFAGEPARGNRGGPVVTPLADEIARYIRERGITRPAIVGHSMGGTLAMMIALRHPSLAGRIMAVDILPQPAGMFGGGPSSPLGNSLRNYLATRGGQQLVGSLLALFSPPRTNNHLSDPGVVARATRELSGLDLGPQLPRLRVPLTVVYASPGADRQADIERTFARAYAAVRGARLVRVDDSGHMIMLDRPTRFAAVLRDFLGR
ncbi:MAG: alpha/beta fold hydrolase [Sphingosinicella sp.]